MFSARVEAGIELATDAAGLYCRMAAWGLLWLSPYLFFQFRDYVSGATDQPTLLLILVIISIGLAFVFRYLSTGILNRHPITMLAAVVLGVSLYGTLVH
jgi:hypothetical protein